MSAVPVLDPVAPGEVFALEATILLGEAIDEPVRDLSAFFRYLLQRDILRTPIVVKPYTEIERRRVGASPGNLPCDALRPFGVNTVPCSARRLDCRWCAPFHFLQDEVRCLFEVKTPCNVLLQQSSTYPRVAVTAAAADVFTSSSFAE
eukprot:scaffold82729_cov62-Phaeocystis_antarctica.AAC.1